MSTVKADLTLCRGYGNCVMASPEYFDLSLAGEVEVLRSEINDEDLATVTEAARSCPAAALAIES